MPNAGTPASNSAGSTAGRAGRVDRRGAAGQDDRRRPLGQHLGHRHRVRHDLAVDPGLADPAGDQLRVLRPEVDHQDGGGDVPGSAGVASRRPPRAAVPSTAKPALFRAPAHAYGRLSCATSPSTTPGSPDLRSPGRYLLWTGRQQWRTLLARRLLRHHLDGRAGPGALRHRPRPAGGRRRRGPRRGRPLVAGRPRPGRASRRCSASCGTASRSTTGCRASFRAMQLLGRHSAQVGVAIRRRLPTGEVVSAATNDALHIGSAFDVIGPLRRGDRVLRRRGGASCCARPPSSDWWSCSACPPWSCCSARCCGRCSDASTCSARWPASSPRSAPTRSPGCGCCAASAASRPSWTATAAGPSELRVAGVRRRRPAGHARLAPRSCCPASSWSWSPGSAPGWRSRAPSTSATSSRSTATPSSSSSRSGRRSRPPTR